MYQNILSKKVVYKSATDRIRKLAMPTQSKEVLNSFHCRLDFPGGSSDSDPDLSESTKQISVDKN